jgi:flagellin
VTSESAKVSSSNHLRLALFSHEFGSSSLIRLEDVTGAGSGLAFRGTNSGGLQFTSNGRNGLGVMAGVGSELSELHRLNMTAAGTDASGSVNGINFNARGLEVSIVKPAVDLQFRLQDTWGRHGATGARADAVAFGFSDRVGGTQLATRFANATSLGGNALDTFEFVVRQGAENGVVHSSGLRFQIGESNGNGESMSIGLRSVTTASLGMEIESESGQVGAASNDGVLSGGRLSTLATGSGNDLYQNPENALRIVDLALDQISDTRAFLGSVSRDHLQRNLEGLHASIESHTESDSAIRDIDFARETSEFARLQILYSAGVSVLSTANSIPQSVLQLIRS